MSAGPVIVSGAAPASAAPIDARVDPRPSAKGGLAAIRSASFADSVGVGVHLTYSDTAYADVSQVVRALADLGVRHIRDELSVDRPDQWAALNRLAAAGVSSDLIMGSPRDAPVATYVSTLTSQIAGVESVEGTNEWDFFSGSPDWASEVHQRQADLYAAIKSNPSTAALPVLGPSLGDLNKLPALAAQGPLGSISDVANAHAYSNGGTVPWILGVVLGFYNAYQRGQPLVITEAGYHDALNATGGQAPISPAVAANYVPRLFLESLRVGIGRTYLYELLDEFEDPALAEPESNFGLLEHDFTPKPAYYALRTLIRLAQDPRGRSFRTRPLRVAAKAPADLRQLLLAKRDGSYSLVLWRDEPIWDPGTRRPVRVRPKGVRLRFEGTRSLRVYRPDRSSVPLESTSAQDLSLKVGGDVVVVRIGSPSGDMRHPVAPQAPTSLRARSTEGSIRVTWARPDYRTAARWQVLVGGRLLTVDGAEHGLGVRGLAGGRRTSVAVRAVTDHGRSDWVRVRAKGH